MFDLFNVELEFGSFKNVAVGSAGLSWSGGDAGQESLDGELISDGIVNESVGLSLFH